VPSLYRLVKIAQRLKVVQLRGGHSRVARALMPAWTIQRALPRHLEFDAAFVIRFGGRGEVEIGKWNFLGHHVVGQHP
jgi:hypothetical protein